MSVGEEQTQGLRPWDRQPGESEVAHEAFVAHRDSGPPRNLAATARALGKSEALLHRWKVTHRWEPRLLAYDSAQARASEETAQREWERKRRGWSQASEHVFQAVLARLLSLIAPDPETGRAMLSPRVPVDKALAIGKFIMRLQQWLEETPAGAEGPSDAAAELRRMPSQELEQLKQLALQHGAADEETNDDGKATPKRTRKRRKQQR